MIEIYHRMSYGSTTRLNIHTYRQGLSEIETLIKTKSEEFENRRLKFHSLSNLRNLEGRGDGTISTVSLSLTKRKSSMKLRKYSCPEEARTVEDKVDRKKYLLERITQELLEARNKIVQCYRMAKEKERVRRELFINHILSERKKATEVIQKTFRMFMVRKDICNITGLKPNDYIFFYKHEDICTGKLIQLKINNNKSNETLLDLKYSKPLDTHYLVLKDQRVLKKRFKVNFLVNGKAIIDPRYKVDCGDGEFYNVIESCMLVNRNQSRRKRKAETAVHKAWAKVFEINDRDSTHSVSDASVSEQPDIDKFLKKILHNSVSFKKVARQVKPILRKANSLIRKKVTFSEQDVVFQY
jgi:hypothetical protein